MACYVLSVKNIWICIIGATDVRFKAGLSGAAFLFLGRRRLGRLGGEARIWSEEEDMVSRMRLTGLQNAVAGKVQREETHERRERETQKKYEQQTIDAC